MKRELKTWLTAVAMSGVSITALGAADLKGGDFGVSLRGVAIGDGQLVAVGQGAVAVASNGADFWMVARTDAEFHAIDFGNHTFAAVGKRGLIRTSHDGFSWSMRDSGTPNTLLSVVHGGSRFVAVGAQGTICTSADGTRWKVAKSGSTETLAAVAHGNGMFVAVGDHGTIITSSDGLRWHQQRSPTSSYYYAIAFGNGQFVAAGDTVVTSKDGITWQQHPTVAGGAFTSLTYGCGQFVATAARGVFTSVDGLSWMPRLSTKGVFEGVTCGEDGFVAVGWHRGDCLVVTSRDGMAWNKATAEEVRIQARK